MKKVIYEAQGKYITKSFIQENEGIIYNPENLKIEYGASVTVDPSAYIELLAPLTIKSGAVLLVADHATLTVKMKTVLNDGDVVNVRESEEYSL
ncbi:MAG: hypothetical protein II147_04985 [Lachnospiraceae bacterium]|jgi:hypothetical protein|nr:hypothetical protein [Lachnospiraceae bacterium]